jgi:RNA polymerase subunit RPABC4/transcription elongation factor Spt4
MQTCSKCSSQSLDDAATCPVCGSDLREFSTMAVALKKFQANRRVRNVRLVVPTDACPVCRSVEGTYDKNQAPRLPVEGCSEPNGCQAFYEPMLDEIFP